jgi:hypothetical protein
VNQKLAKRLRRAARQATVGRSEVVYQRDRRGADRLVVACTRGIYQRAKKGLL